MMNKCQMDKYKNKYRITSSMLPNWDYNSNAGYYITICTQDHENYFGEIVNRIMNLSEIGEIAKNEWMRTPGIRPDMNLLLDEFVVMPNHFHGIIIIGKNEFNSKPVGRDAMHRVSTTLHDQSKNHGKIPANQFASQSKNLASIMCGFKSSVITFARKHNINFKWKERYYKHIIRDDIDLNRIITYIINNQGIWEEDDFRQYTRIPTNKQQEP